MTSSWGDVVVGSLSLVLDLEHHIKHYINFNYYYYYLVICFSDSVPVANRSVEFPVAVNRIMQGSLSQSDSAPPLFVRSVEFPVAVNRIMEGTVLRLSSSLVLKRQRYNFNQTQRNGGVVDYWMFNISAR